MGRDVAPPRGPKEGWDTRTTCNSSCTYIHAITAPGPVPGIRGPAAFLVPAIQSGARTMPKRNYPSLSGGAWAINIPHAPVPGSAEGQLTQRGPGPTQRFPPLGALP